MIYLGRQYKTLVYEIMVRITRIGRFKLKLLSELHTYFAQMFTIKLTFIPGNHFLNVKISSKSCHLKCFVLTHFLYILRNVKHVFMTLIH